MKGGIPVFTSARIDCILTGWFDLSEFGNLYL